MFKLKLPATLLLALTVLLTLDSCKPDEIPAWNASCPGEYKKLDESKTLTKIGFGSCASQLSPLPLLTVAANQNPDLFIFMGDNIYADTEDMDIMREKYMLLCEKSDFLNLKNTAPLLAVWDDHDFGYNDVGGKYKFKKESKQNFMEFWGETDNIDRMSREGIYDSKIVGEAGKKVQIILLDTRYFRTDLVFNSPFVYEVNPDPNASLLGADQWAWLEGELAKPADIRIIASSIQFAVEFNHFETWANFPFEQQKMYDLIAKTNANGVFFISGDVHYSELSKREPANTYPLYDLTSSGITGTHVPVPNMYRVGNAYDQNNVGQIEIDWDGAATNIKFSILDKDATVLLQKDIALSELQH